jgi:AcrR family transcriptional regulator
MAEKPVVGDQLIEGVREHVSTHGLANLTVRVLAAAGGRSTMCVYTQFDGRKGLLTAAYQHVAGELLGAIDGAEPARAYLAYAADEPHLYSLLFEADLTTLEVHPELRRNLLLAVIERLGPSGADVWPGLHGRICLDRLLGPAEDLDEAVAS